MDCVTFFNASKYVANSEKESVKNGRNKFGTESVKSSMQNIWEYFIRLKFVQIKLVSFCVLNNVVLLFFHCFSIRSMYFVLFLLILYLNKFFHWKLFLFQFADKKVFFLFTMNCDVKNCYMKINLINLKNLSIVQSYSWLQESVNLQMMKKIQSKKIRRLSFFLTMQVSMQV